MMLTCGFSAHLHSPSRQPTVAHTHCRASTPTLNQPGLARLSYVRYLTPEYEGQFTHPQERYGAESRRLAEVLDEQLEGKEYVCNEYSIVDMAIYPWLRGWKWSKVDLTGERTPGKCVHAHHALCCTPHWLHTMQCTAASTSNFTTTTATSTTSTSSSILAPAASPTISHRHRRNPPLFNPPRYPPHPSRSHHVPRMTWQHGHRECQHALVLSKVSAFVVVMCDVVLAILNRCFACRTTYLLCFCTHRHLPPPRAPLTITTTTATTAAGCRRLGNVLAWLDRVRARPGVAAGVRWGMQDEAEVDKWSPETRDKYMKMGGTIASAHGQSKL